ncbi:MAG: rod shape-determining protein MreD [Prevotella sp.]|nr:rod shape-determining protein MreD [Prevotella sp.]
MTLDSLKRLLIFVVLCLAQVLVLNRIHLFGYATLLLYVYFVLLFPRNYPKWAILLWCFALGLVNDTFSNTPGVACASLTLLGVIQPYFLELFVPRDASADFNATLRSLSWGKYLAYAVPMVLFYSLVFFAIEAFNFFNWQQWLISSGATTLLTVVFILTFEYIKSSKQAEATSL